MRSIPVRILLICAAAVAPSIGCAPTTSISYDPAFVPTTTPSAYSDADWATVLRENVSGGLGDYDHLARNREPLDRYLGLISVIGPVYTPNLFPTPSDRICYYINAHNASVLRAVLELNPTPTIHRVDTPRLDYGFRFRVDRAGVTLARLLQSLKSASNGDVRVLFCLSRAAMGSPALSDQSYQPNPLREQMRQAMQRALGNPLLFRVDDVQRKAYVWMRMFAEKDECLAYYRRQSGASGGDMVSFLAHFADSPARERFSGAQGYDVLRMPFDRRLNARAGGARAAGPP